MGAKSWPQLDVPHSDGNTRHKLGAGHFLGLTKLRAGAERSRPMSWGSNTRKFGVCALPLLVVLLHSVSSSAQAPSGPGKVFRRLLAPFRSNPFLVDSSRPCGLGFATCFLPSDSSQPRKPAASAFAPASFIADPTRVVALELRTQHRGPFCHHWLQIESSHGQVTLGYGPATVPFIDAGQISLQDGFGNIERISGMHP